MGPCGTEKGGGEELNRGLGWWGSEVRTKAGLTRKKDPIAQTKESIENGYLSTLVGLSIGETSQGFLEELEKP